MSEANLTKAQKPDEPWYGKVDREAAERLQAMLALPSPTDSTEIGSDGFFDPWEIFPLYGTYSDDFDELAIAVLSDIEAGTYLRDDLAAHMFREMLCCLNLCDYGSSPRVCFATTNAEPLFREWIAKWKVFSAISWGEPTDIEGSKDE